METNSGWILFKEAYARTFIERFAISEDTLKDIYDEDTFSGYPGTPPGSAWDCEMKALYVMIRLTKPNHVLEIGNWKGYSTEHILLALKNNGKGKLTAIDIEENIPPSIKDRINYRIVGDALKYLQEAKHDFDFIAQDGDHHYQHVKDELIAMTDNANHDFYIWSHDYYAPRKAWVNVKQAWDEEGKRFNWWEPLKDSKSNCGCVLGEYHA